MTTLILGAGIAGLGVAYALRKRGEHPIVLERDDTYGGLCRGFEIDGYRFDRFVHLSFATDTEVNRIFSLGAPEVYHHTPNAYNLYKGKWLKHPAQNNLYPLDEAEKRAIIDDFSRRGTADSSEIHDYESWLRLQYGNYFAEHFPMAYTRKYWMSEARDLETSWVGKRLYQPSLDEVLRGANSPETPVTYYAKEMRYPRHGGFKSYLSALAHGSDIRYGQQVVKINPASRQVVTAVGDTYEYDRLISSLPLPEVIEMIDGVPDDVRSAAAQLRCTSGYLISVAMKNNNIPPYLWWYIYDEYILPARVYSPSLKSADNAPAGCASLQMEVYCEEGKYTRDELLARSLGVLIDRGIISAEDVLWVDVRFEPYANVIFDHQIHRCRDVVRSYLSSVGITTIGRFGEWDYLWSDQALLSGLNIDKL